MHVPTASGRKRAANLDGLQGTLTEPGRWHQPQANHLQTTTAMKAGCLHYLSEESHWYRDQKGVAPPVPAKII